MPTRLLGWAIATLLLAGCANLSGLSGGDDASDAHKSAAAADAGRDSGGRRDAGGSGDASDAGSVVVDATPAVLFGGSTGTSDDAVTLQDTWAFDGHDWTSLSPSSLPPPRVGPSCVVLGSSLLLFGGTDGQGDDYQDTWVWNGDWTQVDAPVASSPPVRSYARWPPTTGAPSSSEASSTTAS